MSVDRELPSSSRGARVVVVGEVNPYGADPSLALYPLPRKASGNRLRNFMGLTDAEYLRLLRRVNLCQSTWSGEKASVAAASLVGKLRRWGGAVVVLLGGRVARAFRRIALPGVFESVTVGDVALVRLPHPSGLCRLWNQPGAVDRARAVLRREAPWVPWGGGESSGSGDPVLRERSCL